MLQRELQMRKQAVPFRFQPQHSRQLSEGHLNTDTREKAHQHGA
jgi:hypothetical protein